jgi:hypothetical protein
MCPDGIPRAWMPAIHTGMTEAADGQKRRQIRWGFTPKVLMAASTTRKPAEMAAGYAVRAATVRCG